MFHRIDGRREDPVVEHAVWQLRQQAADCQFAIHAYCFLPQLVHLVVEGLSDASDLRGFLRQWKRRTTDRYRQTTGGDLWQRGYFDDVLREEDNTDIVSRYVLTSPVRAGLVADVRDYRYAGSETSAVDDLFRRAADADARYRNNPCNRLPSALNTP